LNFKHLDFGFVSDFEIRISCFKENDVALPIGDGGVVEWGKMGIWEDEKTEDG
jgi:hypothetical protein